MSGTAEQKEIWTTVKQSGGIHWVSLNQEYQASFRDEDDARFFLAYKTAHPARQAAARVVVVFGDVAFDPKHDDLREAALALYNAGCWQIIGNTDLRHSEQDVLWRNLAEAMGLPPGTATATGAAPQPTSETKAPLPLDAETCWKWCKEAWDALATAADVFEQYGDLHDAKGTPDGERKAERNFRLARHFRRIAGVEE